MCNCANTSYQICPLKDPQNGLSLSSSPQIGWDTTLQEWKRDITYSGHAYAIKAINHNTSTENIVGTITALFLDNKIRVMNMIIHPDHQRKGLATRLLEYLIKKIDPTNSLYLELEGSSMGKRLYEKFGFKTDYEVSSFWKIAEEIQEKTSISCLETEKELQEVTALDTKAFGASRADLLKKISDVANKHILIDKKNDQVEGFVMYTPSYNGVRIGPWVHSDAGGAERLMKAAMQNIAKEFPKATMTVNTTNEIGQSILKQLNFNQAAYTTYHMHRGNQSNAACNRNIYHAIWSFGLG